MRFSVKIFFNDVNVIIPPDYRRYLLSLIKEAFKRSSTDGKEFLEATYSDNKMKPFTFSAYIPIEKVEEESILNGKYINFYFSTNDYEFLMRIYNGLIAISQNKGNFKLFDRDFSLQHFFLMPEKKIEKDKITFKTLSPFLVRDTEDGDYYLALEGLNQKEFKYLKSVKEDRFIEALVCHLKSLSQQYLGYEPSSITINNINLTLSPAKHGSSNPEHENFSITLPALKGTLTIQAPIEVLQLVYDVGIGARRSEGFGMLEVESE